MKTLEMLSAFLDDIAAHPQDPSLWLILADWLEEHDDPRAELVRLTWSLRYEPEHPLFQARQARTQALLLKGISPVVPVLRLADFEFAWIPPGSFRMGSPGSERQRSSDEKHHRVVLTRGFWMAIHPVTHGQWRNLMGDNPAAFTRSGAYEVRLTHVTDEDLDWFPVENVSWDAARGFCVRLSNRVGKPIRLPTEAEWEFACRAGTTTPYHFGSQLNGTLANCDGTMPYGTEERGPYLYRPTRVGCYPPNPLGLYDMHGNIREWCQDVYRSDYQHLPALDPVCDEVARTDSGDVLRVLRGNNWLSNALWCRSAYRAARRASTADDYSGLRVCFTAE